MQRPGAVPFSDPDDAVDKTAFMDGAASTIGTPDDLVKMIKSVYDKSGGFGTVVGFVHDWANPENTMRRPDFAIARHVLSEYCISVSMRPRAHQPMFSGATRSANSAVRASEMKKSMSCICTASTA